MDSALISCLFSTLLVSFLTGCGSGDLGSSSVTINQAQDQDQTNTQLQNEPALECSNSCVVTSTGSVSATRNCSGAAPFVVAVASLDECDSVDAVTLDAEEEFEGSA